VVAPAQAAAAALPIATDAERELALRLRALKAISRAASPSVRPALEKLAESGGPAGEAAMRTLLPHLGLRFDEQLRVTGVAARSPAERAGVRPGDRVISFGGQHFQHLAALEEHAATLRLGDPVVLSVERAGATLELRFPLGGAIDLDGD
jgi:S1-C subfamily serine protease